LITEPNMKKQIYVITYSSAHYAGAPSNCLVLATDGDDARLEADGFMQEQEIENNYEQMTEDDISDDESAYFVDKVELLKDSEHAEFVKDLQQQLTYYPKVNF
jgi:hypothetical protein